MSADEVGGIARTAERMRRSRNRLLKVGLPTVAVLGAGTGVASGIIIVGGSTNVGANGTISACYVNRTNDPNNRPFGTTRLIDPAATDQPASVKSCDPDTETLVTWNTAGPQGSPGPQGAQGPAGAPGAAGAAGAAGAPLIGQTAFGLSNTSGRTYLKIGDIQGESTDKDHKGQIEILSFAIASGPTGDGGQSASKVKVHDIVITKQIDKASPLLLKKAAAGQHYHSGTLYFARKAGKGQQDFLVIKMNDVLISSYQAGVQNGSSRPAEELRITFQKANETFYDTKGKVLGRLSFKLA